MYGWKPGIGDPTVYGWLTVAAYAIGALCCWRARRNAPPRERGFWLVLTGIMAFLCVNKQLDLQTLLTDVARHHARTHGWYGNLVRMRRARGTLWGASIGLALLLLFVFVRAVSFDKVDRLIGLHLGGMLANQVMELGGIAIVAAFAWAASRR